MLCSARALSHLVCYHKNVTFPSSLPHHGHVSERATLGVAEASELITRM